jgi:predicted DNA-binding protein with PD1-like motif
MYIGKLPHKSDLQRELTKFAATHKIEAGAIQLIGSLGRARLSYYDQKLHVYRELDCDAPYEIVSGIGNISLRDDKPHVHLHLAIADSTGSVIGGHCLEGCRVFAVEFTIWPMKGKAPRRSIDPQTGLLGWEAPLYSDAG